MASKRRQAGARREPVFDKSAELRVSPDDRPAPTADKPVAGSKSPARRRKRRVRKTPAGRTRHSRIARVAYWGLVIGLWLAIGVAGFVGWVGAHLPPIQSL
jgi:penicillin-binding protein 1A